MTVLATYIQEGYVVNYTAGADTAYGEVVPFAGGIGVCKADLKTGETGVLAILGVHDIAAVTNAAFAFGDVLFWDNSAGKLTKEASANTPAGFCVAPKATSAAVASVQIGRAMITIDHEIQAGGISSTLVTAPLATRSLVYPVEDLAANASIVARPILTVPTGCIYTIVSAKITGRAAASGVDNANTSVIALAAGASAIVSKTYNTSVAFPAANTPASLGSLNATNKIMAAAAVLNLAVTNGTAADLPAFDLEIVYTVSESA